MMQLLDPITVIDEMPARLKQAFHLKQQLAQQNVFFAPIRHHSPACAFALKQYINEIKPTHILIEAPTSFEFLIQSLQDQATEPPIAIFAQAQSHHNGSPSRAQQDEQHQANQSQPEFFSAYFPFCEYSPEWVAIQAAKQQHAEVKFIDLDWTQQSILKSQQKDADWQQKSLMSERYFAHSQYIQKLAESMTNYGIIYLNYKTPVNYNRRNVFLMMCLCGAHWRVWIMNERYFYEKPLYTVKT